MKLDMKFDDISKKIGSIINRTKGSVQAISFEIDSLGKIFEVTLCLLVLSHAGLVLDLSLYFERCN